jgi:hypothetical protein
MLQYFPDHGDPLPVGIIFALCGCDRWIFRVLLSYTKNVVPLFPKKGGNYPMKSIYLIRVNQSVAITGYLYMRGNH